MSKRFFSLLLVVCMLFALAVPVMAASDDVAVIKAEDFRKDLGGEGKDGANLMNAVDTAKGVYDYNNKDKVYNSSAFSEFKAAYEAAKKIIDDYDNNPVAAPGVTDMNTKANKLKTYVDASGTKISTTADTEDITALKDKVAEAKALLDTLVASKDQTTALKNAIEEIEKAIKDHENGSDYLDRADIQKYTGGVAGETAEDGYIPKLATLMKAAEAVVRTRTVSIKGVSVALADKGQDPTLKIQLTDRVADKDDYIYSVKVTAQGHDGWALEAKDGSGTLTINQGKDITLDAKFFHIEGPDAEDFLLKDGDEITVTLYTNVKNEEYRENIDPPEKAYTTTEVGKKTVKVDKNVKATVEAAAVLTKAEFSNTDDKITFTFDSNLNTIKDYDSVILHIVAPNNAVAEQKIETLNGTTTQIELSKLKTLLKLKEEEAVAPGTYTVTLIGMKGTEKTDMGEAVTFELKAIDTKDLEALIKEIEAIGTDKLAANYGNWDAVNTLVGDLKEAKKLMEKAPYVDSKANTDNKTKENLTNMAAKLKTEFGAVYDITELKSLLDQAKAMDPKDYTNWTSGTMADALLQAKYALARATMSETKLDAYEEDFDGNGTKDKLPTSPDETALLDKDTYDKRVAALKAAIAGLIADPDKTDGLKVGEDGKLYLYKDGEIQKTGYTEAPAGSGIYYYFSVKDGHAFKGGVVTGEGGKKYVADANGVLKTGLVTVGSDAYYCSVKDHHIYRNGIVSAGGTRQYIAGKDGKLLKDKQTVGSNSYYCSVKEYHIWKAVKNTAWVTGTVAKYQINAKGVILATKPLKG